MLFQTSYSPAILPFYAMELKIPVASLNEMLITDFSLKFYLFILRDEKSL